MKVSSLPLGLATRIAFALASPPDLHEVPGGLIAKLRRHRGAFMAEAARIMALPQPIGLLARLENGLRATLPAAIAAKPPAKPVAAPKPAQGVTAPAPKPSAPAAPQAAPQQAAPIDPRMQRAQFDRLSPEARGRFMRAGGRLRD